MHVKNTVTNISDYARNIDIILDPIRGETLRMGYDIYAKKDDFWAMVQRPRQSGAHCSLLPINQMPALTGELVLTSGVVLPPHESRIRKFSL